MEVKAGKESRIDEVSWEEEVHAVPPLPGGTAGVGKGRGLDKEERASRPASVRPRFCGDNERSS